MTDMPEDNTRIEPQTDYYPSASNAPPPRQRASGSATDDAKEKVQQVAAETQHKLGDQLRTGFTSAKDRAASSLGTVARSLSETSQQVRQRDPEAPAEYVERMGQQLQRASEYLRDTDVDQLVDQTEDFARRQPAVFLGAAFAIGVLGARFIKSSRRSELQEQRQVPVRTGMQGRMADRERPVSGVREPGTGFSDIADSPESMRASSGQGGWPGGSGGSATGPQGV
jgi:ElaB/YqjD/DUF883 family membrane-anchored ribosome-binding protein